MVPGVFVFGSNRAGRHGYGTPLYAFRHYGAMDGQGEGRQGDSYAIPIHDERMKTLPIPEIEDSFRRFSAYAASQHHEVFLLTTVGCGVGCHNPADIWAILQRVDLPHNVVLLSSWAANYKIVPDPQHSKEGA
ncbi:hypothetical protein CDV52_09865 [Haematobacter missouriensis]|uniref:Uncharacterized protein n=2 Tax=Haematobacter missouriensis TaxID=366616 RepID=A0A225CRY5_9RHOB|nr:hypothetical protein CDV53_14300 [Haematobacter missouriensis]OWJ83806.1 hypothetical protein CDV52_09865 [Haematobacter missouriensis]